MNTKLLLLASSSVVALSGCFSIPKVDMDQAKSLDEAKQAEIRDAAGQNRADGLRFVKGAYLGSRVITDQDRKGWLLSKRVSYTPVSGSATSARDLAVLLRDRFGLNVSSNLPLDGYSYTGLGVRDVDGETALKLLYGSMGLDYELNNDGQYITIVPMKSRTWTLSIGNRRTTYTTSSANSQANQTGNSANGQQGGLAGNSSASSAMGGGTSTGGMQAGSGQQPGSTTTDTASNNQSQNGINRIESRDSLWSSIDAELTKRTKILIPVASPASSVMYASQAGQARPLIASNEEMPVRVQVPATPGTQSADGESMFRSVKVAEFSTNPDTGAVTLHGPSWVIEPIGKYLETVEARYNTKLTFEGQLLLSNTTADRSEGADVQGFLRWAGGKYGAVLQNTVLNGGVQVSFPSGSAMPNVTTGGQQIAESLLGIVSPVDGLQIFNGYLESKGDVRTLQRPSVSTTHGVPVMFRKFTYETYSIPDQNVAAGGTGSAVAATRNILVKEPLGTEMRINPTYNPETGLVRAQVYFDYKLKVGTDKVVTYVSGSNGTTTQTITDIPKISGTEQSGEILARNGDLVIMSGTVEDSDSLTNGGIAGLSAIPIFGKRGQGRTQQTYYFALRVKVEQMGLK